MAATVESAAIAMESGIAAAMIVTTTVIAAAVKVIVDVSMRWAAVNGSAVARPISPARASIVAAPVIPAAVVGRTPVRVIPGSDAHEHATGKVAGTPIAVRRACVWIIRVVAIGADRLRSNGHRANSNADSDSHLRLCARGREKQNSQQSCIF